MNFLFPSKRYIVALDSEISCTYTQKRERRMQNKEIKRILIMHISINKYVCDNQCTKLQELQYLHLHLDFDSNSKMTYFPQ